jgi:hypothetical protein
VRVSDAPPIITQLDRSLIEAAAAKVRQLFPIAPKDGGELRKLAPDVWAIEGPLDLHTDKTAAGHFVFGVVLVNDDDLVLYRDRVLYDLPVGAVYSLDGHRRHGALAHNGIGSGLFGFLAWDVPRTTTVAELLEDLPVSLQAWADGEERVNVLAAP